MIPTLESIDPVDAIGPQVVTTTLPVRATGDQGWFTGPVWALVRATNQAGIASREYRLDNGPWQTYLGPAPIPIGRHELHYRATDRHGNVSAVGTLQIHRDPTPPTVKAAVQSGNRSRTESVHFRIRS